MAMISPVRTVAPASEPVTLQQVKEHLRIDADDENTLIAALVSAAVSRLDGWSGILGRCLETQTWRQDYEGFCSDGLKLPFPDVQSVVVAYTDPNGAAQTLAGSNYHLVNAVDGSRVALAYGASWPTTAIQPDAVRVTMVVGYTDVPAAIKAAILLHVGHLYVNREAVGEAQSELPLAYDALTGPYRRVGV